MTGIQSAGALAKDCTPNVIRRPQVTVAGLRQREAYMSTAKEELTRINEAQPEDSSRDEIVRELAFHIMAERGLADSDAGRVVSDDEMARRIRSWQK